MKTRRTRIWLLVLLVFALALPAAAQDETGAVEGGLIDEPAIAFEATDLDGNTLRLSDLEGQVVLINFWGVWCTSCRHEIPELVALDRQWRDRGL
ncbi:MAG TPA: hypothetical protein DCP38_11100, partial [Acidobacteria bacterium]|nr:hypothetical protein [Acidobacteriota bacterium]